MTIAELKAGQPGIMLVNPGLRALVTKVHDRKTGTGNYGEWSMQAIALKDNTGEINAVIWGRPDLSNLAGKEIHLSALNTEGRGWAGCMVEDRKYTNKQGENKTARQIKASGVFLLEEAGAAAPANPAEAAPERTESPNGKPFQPTWTEYIGVAKAAHHSALLMEPDSSTAEGSSPVDRSRARMAFVNTVLMAYGKRDFKPDTVADDDIPF